MKLNMMRKLITIGITGTAMAASMAVSAADYKHVAVAPEQMEQQRLPSAQSKGLFSHSTMLPITAASLSDMGRKGQSFEQKIYLDGPMDSPIVMLSPDAGQWFMSVTNPMGKVVFDELASAHKALPVDEVAVGSQSFAGKQLQLQNPMAGEWRVKLTRKGGALNTKATKKDVLGYLLYKGDTAFQARSYLDNNFTTQGSDVNVVASMMDTTQDRGDRAAMLRKEALLGSIDSAVALVKSPSGERYSITLNDEGINGDKVAGDGQFGAKMPTGEVGVYTNQVQISGKHISGKQFTRTVTDIYPVAEQTFDFADKTAQLNIVNGTSAVVSVPVKQLADADRVHMSAEIWGTNAEGKLESAAWAGGIVAAGDNLELKFDTRWLTRQGLQAPYSLKSVRLQNADNNVPMAQANDLPLKVNGKIAQSKAATKAISKDMLMGKAPAKAATERGTGSKLLLVHGYCSGQAWLEGHFSGADEFQNYKQSITHDTFAQRVDSFGDQYNSYGIVAHSQGGAAALTLYSRYWSGLDNAGSGRLIQSVGTPYQGTALAGNLAALGNVFGAGCGYNTDLTYSGATNWLATVPSWAKAKVNYYTTSFETKWWRYDYCHLATDLFLDDPEDGTTEKWSGQLSGASNRGHTTGQCHTSGMRDRQQTRDTSRNSSMNGYAAR